MEIKDLQKYIKDLSESDAKSFLISLMLQIKMIQESKDSHEEKIGQLNLLYKKIIDVTKTRNVEEKCYSIVHLVCGESAASSLRKGLGTEHKVIGIPDFFAVGPIWQLHQENGRKYRYDWLKDHLNYPDDYLENEYEDRFLETLDDIERLDKQVPIVIWTAENANEQTGLRYLLYLLRNKNNEIYLINTTLAFQVLFNSVEYGVLDIHSGEVSPEKFKKIYEEKLSEPISIAHRRNLEEEWLALSESRELVRIWENNQIRSVAEDYFDKFIVDAARKLHREQIKHDFIKAARLIGEVYGKYHYIGDAFIEYRVRSLIYKGVFEIKGVPKGMRYYSVKLKL